jgi:hypothetical protein
MKRMQDYKTPHWARYVLYAAAAYNLVWGAIVIFAPLVHFRWAGMAEPRYPQIWQCVGMIVGVYGVGYWLAARDPFRHWPIVLVGLLGKILGPIGFLNAALTGALPWKWGATIITNDLIWWVPFVSILYLTFRENTNSSRGTQSLDFKGALRSFRSQRNARLDMLSAVAPTLVVFLRHEGCTFCREALSQLQDIQIRLQRLGFNLAVVHMGSLMDGTILMQKWKIDDVHHFSDPHCVLYRAFGLERGTWLQLFSPTVLKRGWKAIRKGHGLGRLAGDGFRMPGAFVVIDGQIVVTHRSSTVADHPNYADLISDMLEHYDSQLTLQKSRDVPEDAAPEMEVRDGQIAYD